MAPKKAYYPISVVRTIPAMALLLLAFLVSSLPMRAQGWEKAFGGNKEDQGLAVIETIDRGYLVVGFSESFPNGADQDIDVYIIKTDVDGQMTWDTTFDIGFTEYGNAALQTADGGFLIAGEASFEGVQGPFKAYLLKITDRGKYQWSYTFDDAPGTSIRIKDVTASPDGGYLMVGFIEYPDANDDIFLLKVDDNGQEQWRKAFGIPGDDMATAVDVIGDGYVITGNEDNPFGVFDRDMIVYRLDGNGEVVWKRGMSTNEREVGNDVLVTHDGNIIVVGAVNDNADAALWKYGPNGNFILLKTKQMFGESDEANSVIELEDGSLVVAGFTEVSAINVDFMLIKYSQDGDDVNEVWATHTGDVATTDFVSDIAATSDGGYVLTGYNAQWLNIFNDIVLTRTDGEGNIYTNYIRGKVFYDQDEGCDLDNGEPPFSNWLVRASGPDRTFFGSTDQNGNYLIRVDTGDYVVEAIPANSYWESCSPNGVPLSLTNFYDTTLVHLPIKDKDIACPYLEVDISTPFLAACSDVTYTVDYENTGTTPADGAYVEVTLDDELTFVNASIPFTSLGENVYRFDLGSIPFNSEGAFTINTQMACSGIASGQAGLVEAHIFPDSLCTEPDPNWDGASIDVDGQCVNDTLRFKIENVGQGGMLMPRNFFVIEEDVMFLTKPFDLGSGQDTTILIPANGSTYRIIAEQSPGHPGNSYPTAAVEGCVTGAGTYSTGYVNDFPENDLDPFRSVQVDEVMENVGPVQLIAHPAGIQDSIISADIPLTYRYIFRNIGNDTVSRVIIRDTLPPGLDPGSIRPGASSHPYRFEVYFDGVVKLSFDDIQLPQDPTGNDPSSYGYAEFSIGQNPDNHVGTVIENTATVIFDYYAPMRTNTVRHYVGVDSLTRLVQVVSLDINGPEAPENLNIKVYPNPFVERATVEVTGWPSSGGPLEFTLFSQDGKLVHITRERANAFTVQRNALPAGTYFYSLRSEGKLLGSGTLIVR